MKRTLLICTLLSLALLVPTFVTAETRRGFSEINATSHVGRYSVFKVVAKKGFLKRFTKTYTRKDQNLTYKLKSAKGAWEKVAFGLQIGPNEQCVPNNIQRLIKKLNGSITGWVCGLSSPAF